MNRLIFLLLLAGFWAGGGFAQESPGLEPFTEFGSNPGDLKAYIYAPKGLPAGSPLVVVLHGCGMDPQSMAQLTGWNTLADRHQFLVLYPAQQRTNNIQNCFNWFLPGDVSRNQGEAASIAQMIRYLSTARKLDSKRVFITGMSAGGAMTTAMLAGYPELFSAGAALSGTPYGAAADLGSALSVMQGKVDREPQAWAGAVSSQNAEFKGAYPRLLLLHGADDPIVHPANARELAEQWTALHRLDAAAGKTTEGFEGNAHIEQTTWTDPRGRVLVERFLLDSLGHAIPVDPGAGPRQGGQLDRFAIDLDFFSTYWVARFFQLVEK